MLKKLIALSQWYTNVVLTGGADGWILEVSEEDPTAFPPDNNQVEFAGRVFLVYGDGAADAEECVNAAYDYMMTGREEG